MTSTSIILIILLLLVLPAGIFIIILKNEKLKHLQRLLALEKEKSDALEKISNRENNLKDAQSLAHVGSYIFEVLNNTLEWSDELYKIYGLPAEDGPPSWEEGFNMIHPEDKPGLLQRIKIANDKQELLEAEYRIIRKDGSVRNLLLIRKPVLNEKREMIKYFGAILDISDRKTYEDELRKLSRVVEQSPASIVITNPQGTIEYVNPKFIDLTGYTSEEVLGKNPRILKSGLTPDETYQNMWYTISQGKSWSGEYCNRKKNGELYWEAAIISPVLDDTGKITHFVAIKEDITKRKKIEDELRENKIDLNHAQSVAHIGSWRIDIRNNTLTWSDETFRIFETPVGTPINYELFLTKVHPDDREFLIAQWNAALTGQDYDIEHRIQCGSNIKWVREKADLEFDENQNLIGAFGIVQDITELKRAEEEIKTQRQWLDRIAETSPDIIYVLNLRLNSVVYCNRSVTQVLGYSPQEFKRIQKITKKVILDQDLERVETFYQNMKGARNDEIREISHRVYHKDGSQRWLDIRVTPFNWDKDGCLSEVIGIARDITEAKNIEAAKFENEERISALLNSVDDSIWLFAKDGTILLSNRIAAERIGHKIDEIAGTKWQNYVPSDLAKLRQEKLDQVVKTGLPVKFEDERSGFHFHHNFYPVKNSAGDITGIAVFSRDITDIVKQEKALGESEGRFRQLADSMPQVVWTAEPDGVVDYYNSRASELDGISQVASNKWIWEPVLHEDDVEPTVMAWNHALLTGTTYEIAHRVKLKNGQFRWVLSRGIPVKNNQGQVIKWYGTATDIDFQKEIESRLSITLSQLAESTDKLNEAQKLAHIGSYLLDLKSGHLDGSDELFNILEIKTTGVIKLEQLLRRIHEEDISKFRQLISDATQDRKGIDSEFRYKAASGMKYLKIVSKPMLENETITRLFGTAMDITEQKIQAQKIENILAELKRSNKDLEQFAYTASHDLQEPIRMIKSYAQLLELKHKKTLDTNAREYLYFITEGASRMQQLVNDLLTYSRVTTTKQEMELIDPNVIVQSVLEDLKFRIQEESAVINTEHLPRVKGDKTQIRQLFQNLIQNSIKFRREEPPVINIKCTRKRNEWLFSVSDNGIGIDPQFFERIFIIFQRLHEREKYAGTGVGLAICKKIIEKHGGRIFVESEINKGTTFYFTLP